jgi:hypothetical protein
MNDDDKPDLFGYMPPPAAERHALKAVASKTKQSPIQREFDRLVSRIEEAQRLLADWKVQPIAILEKYQTKMEPAQRELVQARKEMIVQLDSFVLNPPKGLRMTARRREALTECLLDLIDAVAGDSDAPDDTLIAIAERHGDTFAQDDAEDDPEDDIDEESAKAEIVGFIEKILGISIEPLPGESLEAFAQRAQTQLEQTMAAEAQREEDKRQQRAEKRAKKKAGKAQSATTVETLPPKPDLLRSLYRKLASNIHPDREHNLEEKARKTESMQGLNTAYQNKDLLAILKLHNETLQSETASASIAEDTLREYNKLLKDQLKSIETEIFRTIDEVVPPEILFSRGKPKRPEQLQKMMDQDIERVIRSTQGMRASLHDLNDPKLRSAAVNEIVEMIEQSNKAYAFEDSLYEDIYGR